MLSHHQHGQHKVFPEEPAENRVHKLWECIFKTVRVDTENPVEAWKKHDETLHEKVDYLNEKRYKKFTIQLQERI